MTISYYKSQFAKRLKQAREDKYFSRTELAKEIQYSYNSVYRWEDPTDERMPDVDIIIKICQFLEVSIDWIIGHDNPKTQLLSTKEGIQWEENTENLSPATREIADVAIDYFRTLVNDNIDGQDYIKTVKKDYGHLGQAWLFALRTGIWKLRHVPRDAEKEDQLKKAYNLKYASVAKLDHFYDGTPIRAEFVAFLAAQAMAELDTVPKKIGVDAGYTMLRFAEQFSDYRYNITKWIPLVDITSKKDENVHSASDIARLLSLKLEGKHTLNDKHWIEGEKRIPVAKSLMIDSIIFSCNGFGRQHRKENTSDMGEQFRTADYLGDFQFLREAHKNLSSTDKDNFAGMVLGIPLLMDGHIVDGDETENILRKNMLRVDETILRRIVRRRQNSIIVASRLYKAKAVYAAIQNPTEKPNKKLYPLANCVVIDSEIADYLLERAKYH